MLFSRGEEGGVRQVGGGGFDWFVCWFVGQTRHLIFFMGYCGDKRLLHILVV